MWLVWEVVALLGGLGVLGFGINEAVIQHRLRRGGIRVRGLVVRHHVDYGNSDPLYCPVVEFVDAQGIRHTFQDEASGVKRLPVGGGVPVRYLPDAPQRARIDLTGRLVGNVVFLLGGGTALTAIGIWLLATGR